MAEVSEAVARAIAGVGYGDRKFHPWDCLKQHDPEEAEFVREQARAAIAAMAAASPQVEEKRYPDWRDGDAEGAAIVVALRNSRKEKTND